MPGEPIMSKQKLLSHRRIASIGDRDETVNYISECSKLIQKELKSRYDWVGNVIYGDLCKRLIFGPADKWYMHKPESVPKKKMHKILWDFEIQSLLEDET